MMVPMIIDDLFFSSQSPFTIILMFSQRHLTCDILSSNVVQLSYYVSFHLLSRNALAVVLNWNGIEAIDVFLSTSDKRPIGYQKITAKNNAKVIQINILELSRSDKGEQFTDRYPEKLIGDDIWNHARQNLL